MNKNKRLFLGIFLGFFFGCGFFLPASLDSQEFAEKHAPPLPLKNALDEIFNCTKSPSSHVFQNKCSGQCRFFTFVKWCRLHTYRETIRQQNASVKKFFKRIKILQLETQKYLDKVSIICTFDDSLGILKNYVLKIRVASDNPSRIVTTDGRVIEGVQKLRNISRIIGAERIRKCIDKYKFKHVIVPKKYLYHLPGRPYELNDDNYIVVAEKVKSIDWDRRLLTQKVANEIFRCTWESNIFNPADKNIIVTQEGKFAFIDTECLITGPKWYKTLWRSFAFHMAHYSFPCWIKNPYLACGILTKDMVTKAMKVQRRVLEKRHWLKMPYGKGITIFKDESQKDYTQGLGKRKRRRISEKNHLSPGYKLRKRRRLKDERQKNLKNQEGVVGPHKKIPTFFQ